MEAGNRSHQRIDPLTVFLRLGTRTAVFIAVIVAVKLFLVDLIAVKGDQMTPAIVKGDRLLTFRLASLPGIRNILPVSRGRAVVFTFPFSSARGCLRVAAIAGDTVIIDSGTVRKPQSRLQRIVRFDKTSAATLMPPDFSPRDFMPRTVIPRPGAIISLDSLDLFSYFTALSIIRQENTAARCSLSVTLLSGGITSENFHITDFVLYTGPLKAVPDSLRYNWFFWDRLTAYLNLTGGSRQQRLHYSFYLDGAPVRTYAVKNRFLFLIADNWTNGNDSRFFGPVLSSRVIGRPLAVTWSISAEQGFNVKRLGKFIP